MALVTMKAWFKTSKVSLLSHCARHLASTESAYTVEEIDKCEWNNARPYEEIPGPKSWPIIGPLPHFLPGIGYLSDKDLVSQLTKALDKYGKVIKLTNIPGKRDMVFLFDPIHFEEMYRKEGVWPERDFLNSLTYYRKVHRKDFFQGVGGLMTENGEEWKKFRSKVNPPMLQHRITKKYLPIIISIANAFIERMKSLRDSKDEMPDNYINEIFKWALETVTMVALDKRLGCLEPNMKPDSEPQRMINAIGDFFECCEILDFRLPVWNVISTPTWRRYTRTLDYFTEMAMKHVNKAIDEMQKRPAESEHELSVLELLLQRDSNPKTACVMSLDFITAGVDTTSYAMASLLYHLSKNQDKQQYLYEELQKFMPNRNDNFTIDDIEEMKYLKACIKESMRLSAIFTSIMRGTQKDVVIGNYCIPKNVNVVMVHLIASRMEENFPHASCFIPERWLKVRPGKDSVSFGSAEDYDRTNFIKANPFVVMPFGFGPRMCIGRRFSELELTVLTAKVIRHFQVEYNYGEMEYFCKFINKPINPLKFKMTDRLT